MNKDKKINKTEIRKILEIKKALEDSGVNYNNLVYMPVVPYKSRWSHGDEYVIEEVHGIKIARLVTSI